MRIERIHIEQFGSFSDSDFDFRDGFNPIRQDNGWGKTTLSVFIRAMFYGFPSKGERAKDREKYRPWRNGVYGGSLTFSVEQNIYTIYRVFGKSKSGTADEFHLLDEQTRKESSRWTSDIGEELFGINEESFANSVLITQEGCTVTSDITSRLGGQPDLLEDVKRFDQVIAGMEKHMNHLSPARKTGMIYRKKAEAQELEAELLRAASVENRIQQLEAEGAAIQEKLNNLEKEQKALLELQREYSGWQDFLGMKAMHDALQKEYLNRDEIWETQLKKFPDGIPEDQPDDNCVQEAAGTGGNQKKAVFLLSAGVLSLVISLATGFPGENAAILLFVTGILLVCTGAVWIISDHNKGKPEDAGERTNWDPEQFQQILIRQREVEAARNAWKELQKADRDLRNFYQKNPDFEEMAKRDIPEWLENVHSMGELNSGMSQLNEEEHRLRNALQEQRVKIDRYLDEQSEETVKEEKLSALRLEIEKLEKEYILTERTAKYLSEAKDSFSAKFMESIQRAFQGYYRMIDPDQKEELFIDSSYRISAVGGGIPRSKEVLSRGYRDLANLCLRLALLDSMYEKEKPCIILDDPFVNLDDDKYRRAMGLLAQISMRYQILYFSCRS
ncbi:MAG: AAA family ATPase [Lachnospiraceae bacterium]|nr:AAA family ATPase [Lachnospiraceae bacterium]